MKFADLGLIDPILKAAADIGYEEPSPIQAQAIQPLLARKDLIGCAQTGTGKTAAFAMPVLQILNAEQQESWCPTRALVLTPTRELALQICESFEAYGKYLPLKVTVVFGGVPQHPQEVALRHGVDVLVATPGRLLDLVGQQLVDLSEIQLFVLDEADRMLDMGFLPDVRRVIGLLPTQRQTMLFSATMPNEIAALAQSILHDPVRVAVDPVSSTVDAIEQEVYFVAKENKRALLASLLKGPRIKNALVFVRTKHGADKVARDLSRDGVRADSIHGDKTQSARQYALSSFKEGHTRVLVATDIAARGIDIDELAFVINYDMPSPAENYVHRIGRTGRAGHTGNAISFCDSSEYPYLLDVEKLTGKRVPVVEEHPYAQEQPTVGRRGQAARPVDRPKKAGEAPKPPRTPKPERPAPVKAVAPISAPVSVPEQPQTVEQNRPERAARPPRKPREPVAAAQQPSQTPDRSQSRSRQPEPSRSPRIESSGNSRSAAQTGLQRGLPSIRDVSASDAPRETVVVENINQLPKPPIGHFLLNSFADTGVDYRMTENPEADNAAIESLGFYTPPAGALRAIYGDEYDGNDIDFTIRDEPVPPEPAPHRPENGEAEENPEVVAKRRRRRRSRSHSATDGGTEVPDMAAEESADGTLEENAGKLRENSAPCPSEGDSSPAGQEAADAPETGEAAHVRSGNRPRRRRPRGPRPPRPDAAQPVPEGFPGASSGNRTSGGDPDRKSQQQNFNRRRRRRPDGSGESSALAAGESSGGIVTRSEQPFYGEN